MAPICCSIRITKCRILPQHIIKKTADRISLPRRDLPKLMEAEQKEGANYKFTWIVFLKIINQWLIITWLGFFRVLHLNSLTSLNLLLKIALNFAFIRKDFLPTVKRADSSHWSASRNTSSEFMASHSKWGTLLVLPFFEHCVSKCCQERRRMHRIGEIGLHCIGWIMQKH